MTQQAGRAVAGKTSLAAVPGQPILTMTRVFDAPRDLVFRAYTDPAAVPHWWGPGRYATTVEEMDVRFGGTWRYVSRDDEGNEYTFRGVYHEVLEPERLVSTFEFEGAPGHVLLQTATLDEHGGQTTLTAVAVFPSVDDRDQEVSQGMEEGASESWDRLEQYIGGLS